MKKAKQKKKHYTPANADMTIVHSAEFDATPSPEPPGPPAIAKCTSDGVEGGIDVGQKPQTTK